MIELRMDFASLEEVRAFFNATHPDGTVRMIEEAREAPSPAPAKRGRKASKATEASQAPAAGGAAADPLAGLLAPQAPVMQPAVAAAIQAPAAPQVQMAPAEQPKAIEQKDLLAAFTAVGKAKGRDALAAICAELGATAVIGPVGVGIPQDKWALAVARCNQVLAA